MEITVPGRMVDFAGLRVLCLLRHKDEPLELWTTAEMVGISLIHQRYAHAYRTSTPESLDWREIPGLQIVIRDLEELPPEAEMPKWMALASWLTPESVAGTAPDFIAEVAQAALAGSLANATRASP